MSYLADYHGGYCSNPEREAMGPKAYMGYGFWQSGTLYNENRPAWASS
jgi:hypothetical protein